jgi:exosome complex RNA-binding protein Csl4
LNEERVEVTREQIVGEGIPAMVSVDKDRGRLGVVEARCTRTGQAKPTFPSQQNE